MTPPGSGSLGPGHYYHRHTARKGAVFITHMQGNKHRNKHARQKLRLAADGGDVELSEYSGGGTRGTRACIRQGVLFLMLLQVPGCAS